MQMRTMKDARTRSAAALAALALALSGAAAAVDSAQAVRAANVWRAYEPGDDVRHDFRAGHVLIADFDRDGVDEIVYLGTATCNGSTSDCQNDIYVMTPLTRHDPRIHPGPLDNDFMTDFWRRARASGYGNDASLHIPGDVERVAIVGRRICVVFTASLDSPICLRKQREAHPRMEQCPPPGRYAWVLSWRKGQVLRERETKLALRRTHTDLAASVSRRQ
jgi:hypothetical protein